VGFEFLCRSDLGGCSELEGDSVLGKAHQLIIMLQTTVCPHHSHKKNAHPLCGV